MAKKTVTPKRSDLNALKKLFERSGFMPLEPALIIQMGLEKHMEQWEGVKALTLKAEAEGGAPLFSVGFCDSKINQAKKALDELEGWQMA